MPKLLQGDSARVVQIFANLISNSIKFTTCNCRSCSVLYRTYDRIILLHDGIYSLLCLKQREIPSMLKKLSKLKYNGVITRKEESASKLLI